MRIVFIGFPEFRIFNVIPWFSGVRTLKHVITSAEFVSKISTRYELGMEAVFRSLSSIFRET